MSLLSFLLAEFSESKRECFYSLLIFPIFTKRKKNLQEASWEVHVFLRDTKDAEKSEHFVLPWGKKRDLIVLKQIVGIMDKEVTADSQDIW